MEMYGILILWVFFWNFIIYSWVMKKYLIHRVYLFSSVIGFSLLCRLDKRYIWFEVKVIRVSFFVFWIKDRYIWFEIKIIKYLYDRYLSYIHTIHYRYPLKTLDDIIIYFGEDVLILDSCQIYILYIFLSLILSK